MGLILLGIGGIFGSLARFQLGIILSRSTRISFPIGTFIVNITGAFLLGVLSGVKVEGNMYLFLADGFLGAYTTFSTFMYEGVNLFSENKKINAIFYVLFTLVIGLLGYALGYNI